MNRLNRRTLILNSLKISAVVPFAFVANRSFAKGEVKFADDTNPVAKALQYNADANKVPAAAKAMKKGLSISVDKQNCGNCSLYTPEAGKDYGKCTMIANVMVKKAGWCTGYQPKAK